MSTVNLNALMPQSMRRDPVLPGPRARLRITCLEHGTTVPGHQGLLRRGVQDVIVNAEHAGDIEEMVEDRPDVVKMAKNAYYKALKKHLLHATKQQTLDPVIENALKSYAAKEHWERTKLDEVAFTEEQARAINRFTGSWQSRFEELIESEEDVRRARKPLAAVERLEELPPELDYQSRLLKDIVGQLQPQPGAMDSTLVNKMLEQMNAQQEQMQAMSDELNELRTKDKKKKG